jgi:GTPase SAR1 family protein
VQRLTFEGNPRSKELFSAHRQFSDNLLGGDSRHVTRVLTAQSHLLASRKPTHLRALFAGRGGAGKSSVYSCLVRDAKLANDGLPTESPALERYSFPSKVDRGPEWGTSRFELSIVDVPGQAELLMSNLSIMSVVHGILICVVDIGDTLEYQDRQLRVWLAAANECFGRLLNRIDSMERFKDDENDEANAGRRSEQVQMPVVFVATHIDGDEFKNGLFDKAGTRKLEKRLGDVQELVSKLEPLYSHLFLDQHIFGVNASNPGRTGAGIGELRARIAYYVDALSLTGTSHDWYAHSESCRRAIEVYARSEGTLCLQRDTILDRIRRVLVDEKYGPSLEDDAIVSASLDLLRHLQVIGFVIAPDHSESEEKHGLLVDVERLASIISFVHLPKKARGHLISGANVAHALTKYDIEHAILTTRMIDEKLLRKLIAKRLVLDYPSLKGTQLDSVMDQAVLYMEHANMLIDHSAVPDRSSRDADSATPTRRFVIPALELRMQLQPVKFYPNDPEKEAKLCHHRMLLTMETDRSHSHRNVLSRFFATIRAHVFKKCQITLCHFYVNEVRVHLSHVLPDEMGASSPADSMWLRVVSNGLEGSQFAFHFVHTSQHDADGLGCTSAACVSALGDCVQVLLSAYPGSLGNVAHIQKIQKIRRSWYFQYRELEVSDINLKQEANSLNSVCGDADAKCSSDVLVDSSTEVEASVSSSSSGVTVSPSFASSPSGSLSASSRQHASSSWRTWLLQLSDAKQREHDGCMRLSREIYNHALLHTESTKLCNSGFPRPLGVAQTRVEHTTAASLKLDPVSLSSHAVSWLERLDDALEAFELIHMAFETFEVVANSVSWRPAMQLCERVTDAVPFLSSLFKFASHLADLRLHERNNATRCSLIADSCSSIHGYLKVLNEAQKKADYEDESNQTRLDVIENRMCGAFRVLNNVCQKLDAFMSRGKLYRTATAEDDMHEVILMQDAVNAISISINGALTVSNALVKMPK